MLLAEIKNMTGFLCYQLKGEDAFVKEHLAPKLRQAKAKGLIVSVKPIPHVKVEPKSQSSAVVTTAEDKDAMLTRWFLDWPTNRR